MDVWQSSKTKVAGTRYQRVVVIGLDGAPYSLLNQFIKNGVMPNLAQIVNDGALMPMETSIPDISSVAWTSFFTGVNPAKHGVFGFMDLKPQSYEMYFPNSHNIQAKTLWEVLAGHGKRSIIINVPSTYPAKPLNGMLISGFVAIDLAKATYPASLLPLLKQVDYQLDVDATMAKESLELFADNLTKCLDAREKVLWRLLTGEAWDLFVGVITETDRMHHYLWDAIEDPHHTFHGFFKSIYSRIDQFIGRVYEQFRGKGLFMIMSDHGFCKIQHEVYLNYWLTAEGYLKFPTSQPTSYEDLDKTTTAFNLDPGRIFIHTKKRYPRGCVEAGREYDQLREELRSRLTNLQIDGHPVVQKVFFKEELYHGPLMEFAPDLLVLPHWGYDLKGSINKRSLTGRSALTGMHTQNDAVYFINVHPHHNGPIHIMDIAPTVVNSLGIDDVASFDRIPLIG